MKNETEKYKFEFSIGQKVKVIDLNIKGRISGILISRSNIEYQVRYFYENKVNHCYFEPDELEIYKGDEIGLGFKENK